jgi:hypothetical protein
VNLAANVRPHRTIQLLARLGYAVKGALYVVVGGLAVMYVLGEGGKLTDNEGALRFFRHQPFGTFLVWAAAVGLAGYALWRFVQAIADPERRGAGWKHAAKRVGFAVSGVVHAGLAIAAAQLAMGVSRGGHGGKWTYVSKVLTWPGGELLVAGVALAIVGVGVFEIWNGGSARFMEKFAVGEMSARQRTWAERAGRVGLIAHGVVFGIVGYFLLRVASSGKTSQAKSLGGALRQIAVQGHGMVLLGIVAVGLVGYAAHMFFTARFVRIDVGR